MKDLKRYIPYIDGVLMATIFGFSFLFTKNSMDIMSPFQILAFRFAAAAILLQLLRWAGVIKINLKLKECGPLLLIALIQPVMYFPLETIGIKMTSSSEAGMMMALIPVFVTILGAVLLKEKPSIIQGVFVLVSVGGVILIVLAQGTKDMGSGGAGILSLLGAVISAGMFNILSRKFSYRFKPVETTYVMMWAGAIVFNIAAFIHSAAVYKTINYFTPLISANAWTSVLYLGVLSSVAAFFMSNYMLSKIPASQSSVFSNLTTIISILAGVIFRGEVFHWYQCLGGIMILLGVWGTNYFSILSKRNAEVQL